MSITNMRGEVRGACRKKFAGTCYGAEVSSAENRKIFFPARAPHLSALAVYLGIHFHSPLTNISINNIL
jgi:hypothetical protein